MTSDPGLSIGELSDVTGVKTVTLRAWERRHGLLKPRRSDGGHRLYGQQDVKRVLAIRGWLEQGVSIGQVRPLLEQRQRPAANPDASSAVEACLAFNGRHLEQLFNERSRSLPLSSLYREWIVPVRRELMLRGGPAAAALAFWDRFLIQKLAARVLKESRQMRQRPALLVQCLPGADSHPAALVCQLLAIEQGWPTIMLGQVLTGRSLAQGRLAESLRARILVLAPGSRLADLRQACKGMERLALPHLLLDVSARAGAEAASVMDWQYQSDSPLDLVAQLQREQHA